MRSDLTLIGRELNALENIQADLAAVATRTDDRRRHDLIDLRQKLSQQIAQIGKLADAVFASVQDPDMVRIYRAKFSAMRSAAALHQADWPAVRLGESVEAYRKSAARVREANRDFILLAREALAKIERD